MSAIRSSDTKIERIVRSGLWRRGYRFRKNVKELPGKPDIVFTRAKVAVFCDSDFWHGRDWETLKQRLTTNANYWVPKIERNRERDQQVTEELRQLGWAVLRFWESDILADPTGCIDQIVEAVDCNRARLH